MGDWKENDMKIALAQMNIKAGQIDLNLAEMKQSIDQALSQEAELIIFPEMAVGGYLISDFYLREGFTQELLKANETIKVWSKEIGIIWGNLAQSEDDSHNRDGRKSRFNAAYFAQHGQWVQSHDARLIGHYYKHCLPDYRFFDDSRYFKSGLDDSLEQGKPLDAGIQAFIFESRGQRYKIGLEVCEDLWSQDYLVNPTEVLAHQGVDFIVNISTSPWTLNKELSRSKRIQEHVLMLKEKMVPILYVNACGMQNTGKNVLLFDGGSTVYTSQGSVHVGLRDDFESELKVFDFEHAQAFTPTSDKLLKGIMSGIRQFDQQVLRGNTPWIIGLSGGIDSSVNACLLTKALGPKRVIGYNMASRFNQESTKSIARDLASNLGIEFHEGSIEALVEATHRTLAQYQEVVQEDGLAFENIQARLRGHLLSSLASYKKGVICNNGNKVELALGYATLYGDTIGALSPLGDCTKVQIFDLAQSLNRLFNQEIINPVLIPSHLEGKYEFELPPSAELKTNQVDPMKWGYHDWLVQYLVEYPSHHPTDWLKMYLRGEWKQTAVATIMVAYGLDDAQAFIDDYRWFMKVWHAGIFKRIQFPPIITVSRGSFGFDYRESQGPYVESEAAVELIDAILKEGKVV